MEALIITRENAGLNPSTRMLICLDSCALEVG